MLGNHCQIKLPESDPGRQTAEQFLASRQKQVDQITDTDKAFVRDEIPGDGTYLVPQPTVQHNSVAGDPATYGNGFRIVNPPAIVTSRPLRVLP